jgi:hypothetical protein
MRAIGRVRTAASTSAPTHRIVASAARSALRAKAASVALACSYARQGNPVAAMNASIRRTTRSTVEAATIHAVRTPALAASALAATARVTSSAVLACAAAQ